MHNNGCSVDRKQLANWIKESCHILQISRLAHINSCSVAGKQVVDWVAGVMSHNADLEIGAQKKLSHASLMHGSRDIHEGVMAHM